jgi:hypothetical protein
MKRILVIAIAAIMGISAISVGFIILESEPILTLGGDAFTWCVDEGDEYTFTVNVTGLFDDWLGNSYSGNISWYSENVTIRILELPAIPFTVNNDTFVQSIIVPRKVTCVSSAIPKNYSSLLEDLLSNFILPVVDWEVLDEMFKDTLPHGGGYPTNNEWSFDVDYFAAYVDDSAFYIAKTRFIDLFPNTGSESWRGWINMTSGLVKEATYSYSYPTCTSYSSLRLEITLIE